ncbi:5-oxoprolinase subunit PxpA [Sphingorhabdus sp. Alg239-R122]|uniref:LamB/YcsF family protein n=1 Tax=Sphingorhabdus sp. Alg239-R122 TaxID=2305989 RepID=UPI001F072F81|nr:5-oxoprolinase subunit PxpA [Sphingorhabdus sp. Alg239-R122]
MQIDLNADLGEDESAEAIARDTALMQHISSCNIACGGHAGSAELMRTMLMEATKAGIAAGAHPSYPDRAGFGRTAMNIAPEALCQSLISQIQALTDIAAEMAVPLTHIKPHGALYNDLAADHALADTVASALHGAFPDLKIVGLAHSLFEHAVHGTGAVFVREAFIDRRYTRDRELVPRSCDDAVLRDEKTRIAQALSLVRDNIALADNGEPIEIAPQSLCIHSDSPGAVQTADAINTALAREGVKVTTP